MNYWLSDLNFRSNQGDRKWIRSGMKFTSVGVEHDIVEEMISSLGDEFMSFENIGEVIFVHFM